MSNRKFFSLQNGTSSSSSTSSQQNNQHNGHSNGMIYYEPKVVIPEMAFFCFDVLHKELHGLERHVEPNHLGISNSAL
jgi:hypothetical protein